MTGAVAVRLAAFAGALAVAFAGAVALGSAVDPVAAADPASQTDAPAGGMGGMDDDDAGHGADQPGTQPPGLAVSEAGYTLVPSSTFFAAGKQESLRFVIKGPDGRPVAAYEKTHEKDLHLIVVRRDLSGFRHVHPTRDTTGTWSIPFTFGAG